MSNDICQFAINISVHISTQAVDKHNIWELRRQLNQADIRRKSPWSNLTRNMQKLYKNNVKYIFVFTPVIQLDALFFWRYILDQP